MLMLQVATIHSQPTKFCMACHFILITLFLAEIAGWAGFFQLFTLPKVASLMWQAEKYCQLLDRTVDNLVDMSGIVLKT